jgi:predicted ester cyclase
MSQQAAVAEAERLAREFLTRVWGRTHEVGAIDELMTEDYVITSAGKVIRGREAFKHWIADFQRSLKDAYDEILDVFASPSGDRVVARWSCTGLNNGVFGLPADGRRIAFSGISIWTVRDGRLAECWVERSSPQ